MSEADPTSRDFPPPGAEPPQDPVGALEARLGTTFADRALALAALTHKSYVNEHREEGLRDNERLEFLGDAVIDLAVSHRLMERFPAAREGDLSKMRAAVVDEQGLSEMARALDLGALLRLGRGEELTGGRQKASLLADAMEAVVAALYVGTGLDAVLGLIDRFLGEAFARAAAGTLDRDYKTQLQELAQSRLRATPRYRVVAERGPDHSKIFEVETDLRGEVVGRGEGRSKKDAEQAAAKLALDAIARRLAAEEHERAAGVTSDGVRVGAGPAGVGAGPAGPEPLAAPTPPAETAPWEAAPPAQAPQEPAPADAPARQPRARPKTRAKARAAIAPSRKKAPPARSAARKGRGTKR
jgi:ribonuclease-3